MSTKHADSQNGTAVRPNTIHLGIDADGHHHIYRTQSETIHVVHPRRGRTRVQDVRGRSIDAWMTFVDEGRGWRDRRYGRGLVEMLERALASEP